MLPRFTSPALLLLLLAPATALGGGSRLYDSGGRRDPFLPALATGPEREPCLQADGQHGVRLDELKLTAIVATPRGPLATFEGLIAGAYFVREGDFLCDGLVEAIDLDTLTVTVHQERDVEPPFRPIRARTLALGWSARQAPTRP